MNAKLTAILSCAWPGLAGGLALTVHAGSLVGVLRDANWFAKYQSAPYGVGYYEFAVNANASNRTTLGGAGSTDVYGNFRLDNLPAGAYTLASWDVWWRSAYAFDVAVPASGNSRAVDLRLDAMMWGYPAFWDDTGYFEFGQTFVATGPLSMVYLRCPAELAYRLTVHEDGPGGRQVGVARTFNGGDQRPIYGYGEMPTVAGRTYYARIRASSTSLKGVIMQMDPRPDYSDPMPGGCLWLGDATRVAPYPDRDLGLILMGDDDGLLTNLYARPGGLTLSGAASIGQSFIARGVGLISAAFWLADPAAPTYVVTVREGGPNGPTVGPVKRGKPARVGADPEMLVTWPPGEVQLVPGQSYYVEVTRDTTGALVNAAYANPNNPYPYGQAYRNQVALSGADLAGTIMEEQSPGSAAMPQVRLTSGPTVAEADRTTTQLTVRWTTEVASDSRVEFAPRTPPYTGAVEAAPLTTNHAVTLSGLRAHTLYHFRVQSAAANSRRASSRDVVICTRPRRPNLLLNPGFEEGGGASPRRPVSGWTTRGGIDFAMSDGTWFWGLPPHSGKWLLEGAVNGSASDGSLAQRVPVTPGQDYTFSAWLTTWPRENNTWKYDVWNNRGRLIYARLGIDPTGGSDPAAATVQWTPRFYSHLHYTQVATTARARGDFLTVFVSLKGAGVQWHLYGVDDAELTATEPAPPVLAEPAFRPDGQFRFTVVSETGTTNRIETSSNLVDWTSLVTMVNSNGVLAVGDPQAASRPAGFYRAVVP